MPENDDRRLCFVIGPIGPKRSPTRNHADYLLKHIIEPVLANEPFNYRVERADGGPPGIITTNIIMNTADAALVVADLTESNANAFYELGICHAFGVPAIHMIDKESPQPSEIPFDNLGYMTIVYSIDNPDDLKEAQNNLRKHAEEINKGDFKVVNPVSAALGLREAILSGDATQVQMAELLNSVSRLSGRISELESRGYVGRPDFFRNTPYGSGQIFEPVPFPVPTGTVEGDEYLHRDPDGMVHVMRMGADGTATEIRSFNSGAIRRPGSK